MRMTPCLLLTSDAHGDTPVVALACHSGSHECTALLLRARADPDRAHPAGTTALMGACRFGHPGAARALVELGRCDLDRTDGCRYTALMDCGRPRGGPDSLIVAA